MKELKEHILYGVKRFDPVNIGKTMVENEHGLYVNVNSYYTEVNYWKDVAAELEQKLAKIKSITNEELLSK